MKIGSARDEIILVAVQSDESTFVMPPGSGAIPLTDAPKFEQEKEFADNDEMADTYAAMPGMMAGEKAGSFDCKMNFKTSGSPGVLSPIHPFLLALYGRHTVNAAVDVRYQHYRKKVDDFVYLSAIRVKTFGAEYITGIRVKKGELKVVKKQIQGIGFNGLFISKACAGTATLKTEVDGTGTPVTTIPLDESEGYLLFDTGAYIQVGADDNTGAGHLITAVDSVANTLTITPGVTSLVSQGATITAFVPTAVTGGYDTASARSSIDIDTGSGSRTINFTESNFTVENGVKALDDICSYDTVSPVAMVEDTRKVTYDVTRYYTLDNSIHPKKLIEQQKQIPVTLTIGKESGKIIEIVMPNWQINKGNESGKPEKKTAIEGQCFPETGDDESTLVLK